VQIQTIQNVSDEAEAMFLRNGFTKKELLVDKRLQVNRGKQIKMFRVWVQGKFLKPTLESFTGSNDIGTSNTD